MSELKNVGGHPIEPNSMRTLIRSEMLNAMLRGSHGPVDEIAEAIEHEGYNPNTIKVQVAQVRGEILAEVGIEISIRGRMSKAVAERIRHELQGKRVYKKLVELQRAVEQRVCEKVIELERRAA